MTRTSARRETPQPTERLQNTQSNMSAESPPPAENSEEVRRQLKKTNLEEERGMSIPPNDGQGGREEDAQPTNTTNGEHTHADIEARGRLRRKRSHEEVEAVAGSETTNVGKHARKRSKSGEPAEAMADKPPSSQDTVEDPSVPELAASQAELGGNAAANGSLYPRSQTPTQGEREEEKESSLLSPKNKRTRDQFLQAGVANEADEGAEDTGNAASVEGSSKPAKRARDSNSPQPDEEDATRDAKETKAPLIPPTSGFANTSATSPFATVASPKSPKTAASAFASSGFSTFASSSASPFAAAAPPAGSGSPFGGFGGKPSSAVPAIAESATKASADVFGGALKARAGNASPFATSGTPTLGGAAPSGFGGLSGSTTSGFGGLSGASAFGSAFAAVKPAAGISSFATPGTVGITGLSSKPAKPFGAAADDEDGDSDNEGDDDDQEPDAEEVEAGIKSPSSTLSTEKKDKRFKEQNIATGEENETTIFTARGKLFINEDKQWKERGTGALKLNKSAAEGQSDDDGQEQQGPARTRARLLLRAEGTQRVVLNSPIQKDLTYGNVKGGKPSSTEHFQFPCFYEGRLQILLVKMKQQNKEELWEHIEAVKKEI